MLTVPQAAVLYDVTPRCVRLWIAAGKLEAVLLARDWRIPPGQRRPVKSSTRRRK